MTTCMPRWSEKTKRFNQAKARMLAQLAQIKARYAGDPEVVKAIDEMSHRLVRARQKDMVGIAALATRIAHKVPEIADVISLGEVVEE